MFVKIFNENNGNLIRLFSSDRGEEGCITPGQIAHALLIPACCIELLAEFEVIGMEDYCIKYFVSGALQGCDRLVPWSAGIYSDLIKENLRKIVKWYGFAARDRSCKAIVEFSKIARARRPWMSMSRIRDIAVVNITGIASDHGAEALALVGSVYRIERLRIAVVELTA